MYLGRERALPGLGDRSLMGPGVNADLMSIIDAPQRLQRPVHDVGTDVEPKQHPVKTRPDATQTPAPTLSPFGCFRPKSRTGRCESNWVHHQTQSPRSPVQVWSIDRPQGRSPGQEWCIVSKSTNSRGRCRCTPRPCDHRRRCPWGGRSGLSG